MKRLLAYAIMILSAASCVQKLGPAGYGALQLSVSSDVETEVQTRTTAGPYDLYNIYISGVHTGNDPYSQTLVYGQTDWPFALPFGLYSVTAESCTPETAHTANKGFGCVRFLGVTEGVQVKTPASAATELTIVCTMANAKVSVAFDEGFLFDFQSVRAELAMAGRTLVISSEEASATQAYFNVEDGSEITYTVYGTIDGVELKYTSSIVLRPAKHARLTFKSNHNGVLGPQVSVDKEIGTNEINGEIDTESGTPVTGGDIEKPVIYVDYEIKDAVEVETVIDVIDKEDMTL